MAGSDQSCLRKAMMSEDFGPFDNVRSFTVSAMNAATPKRPIKIAVGMNALPKKIETEPVFYFFLRIFGWPE